MERTQDFDATPDELWQSVADPAQLAGWLGDEVDIDVQPGGAGTVVDDGEVRHVLVDEVEPGRRLSFTWWPHIDRADRSYVELEVEPLDAGSRLRVRETRLLDAPPVTARTIACSATTVGDGAALRWAVRMLLFDVRHGRHLAGAARPFVCC